MIVTATRYHDFSAGHRVAGHENKCAMLHGHNYRVHFTVAGPQDLLGRVLDFSDIKLLAGWLEDEWDHKLLLWQDDPVGKDLLEFAKSKGIMETHRVMACSTVLLHFNPTAENMAAHLLREVGPILLPKHVKLVRVQVDETRKCSATAELPTQEWP